MISAARAEKSSVRSSRRSSTRSSRATTTSTETTSSTGTARDAIGGREAPGNGGVNGGASRAPDDSHDGPVEELEALFDGTSDAVEFEHAASFMSRLETIVEAPDVPSFSAETSPDDTAEDREIDEMLTAADESRDVETIGDDEEELRDSGGVAGHSAREAVKAAARSAARSSARPPSRPGESPGSSSVEALFSQLQIEHREDGGIRIDAPPEAATALGSLFEGMARIMREAAGRS